MRTWTDHLPSGHATGPVTTPTGTLLEAWTSRWAAEPDAPVWLEVGPGATGGGTGRRWWSAARFEEATRRAAGKLARSGIRPGARVLWSTGSSIDALVAHVGALRAGMVVVPADTAATERELAHVVAEVGPSLAIVEGAETAARIGTVTAGSIAVVGPELDLPAGDPGELDRSGPEDPALVVFTSGTTGAPKGAVLTHGNLRAGAESVALAWRWSPDDRLVHALPVFHAHGLCVGVYGTLLAGSSAVLLPSFDPAGVAAAAADHRATLFFGVPTMYHRLVRSGAAPALAHLRLCVSGSAPLQAALHAEASRAIGSPVLERYGMTETLMITSNPYDGERRAGTVGFPLPGVEVRLSDDAEILVRGPSVFGGYWRRPAADAAAFEVDGDGRPAWFRTGDLGADEEGYLVVKGRSKELIISGGHNVYPAEVEDVLLTHPAGRGGRGRGFTFGRMGGDRDRLGRA